MTNSRNEKVALVLTSYIIGITTSFIAFGLNGTEPVVEVAPVQKTEHVSYKQAHASMSEINTDEEGLFVNVGGYKRIISANRSMLGASVIESTKMAGFAVKHHTPLLSGDGWFAFYCEQQAEDETICIPFVYNLFDDTIHKVTLDGTSTPLTIDDYEVIWTDDNFLAINGYYSEANNTPWVFKSAVVDTDPAAEEEVTVDEEVAENDPISAEPKTETLEDPILQ